MGECDKSILSECLIKEARELAITLERKVNTPAKQEDVAKILYLTQGHYPTSNTTQEQAEFVASNYIRLLDGFSLMIWQKAIDRVLLSKNIRFFPSIPDFKDLLIDAKHGYEWDLRKFRVIASYEERRLKNGKTSQ